MACQYKYTPPGQTQEIWVTEEELKMFFNGIPPTINWWEEPGFKARNPKFDPVAYINSVNKFGENLGLLPTHLVPVYTEEQLKNIDYTLKVIEALKRSPRNKYPSSQLAGFYNDLRKYGAPENQITILKQYIADNDIKEIDKEDLILGLASSISYTVEINTATTRKKSYESVDGEIMFLKDGWNYSNLGGKYVRKKQNEDYRYTIEDLDYKQFNEAYNSLPENPTQHYADMTAPGGINYTENELATPDIVPSIKGHAEFSTDNGIGWFRSDDKADRIYNKEEEVKDENGNILVSGGYSYIKSNNKARRILEIQSDLFQKGRDEKNLVNIEDERLDVLDILKPLEKELIDYVNNQELYYYGTNKSLISATYAKTFSGERIDVKLQGEKGVNSKTLWLNRREEEYQQYVLPKSIVDKIQIQIPNVKNQFLQLLNKDNNWVTFFIKSIIQDSAKKGYEKVLFPVGDTAAKVEGHQALEEFIENKKRSIALANEDINFHLRKIEQNKSRIEDMRRVQPKGYLNSIENYKSEIRELEDKNIDRNNTIRVFQQEIDNAESGNLKFSAINAFYETTVFNVLKKQGFSPKVITDEYGNGWYEVVITSGASNAILLQKEGLKQSKASPKTINKVKEWLHRLGVEIKDLNPRYKGNNGVADLLKSVIQIAEGKEDVALTEESFHFAVEIIELTNPALFKEMMNKIGKYNIYQSVRKLYEGSISYQNPNGTPNIPKLKKEAIGKLLSEMYIQSEEGVTEHPQLLQEAKTWWEKILSFFGVLNKRVGFNPFEQAIESFEDLAKEGAPVKILAQRIIDNFTEPSAKDGEQYFKDALIDTFKSGDYQAIVKMFYQQLTDESSVGITPYDVALKSLGGNEELARQIIALGSPYYQLSAEQKTKQQELALRLDKKLKDFQVEKITGKAEFDEQDDINFYQRIKNGIIGQVAKRVTDFVKESKRPEVLAKFENASKKDKNTYKQKAGHGTAFHADADNIIQAALNSEGYLKPFNEIDTSAIPNNMPAPAFGALSKYLIGYMEDGEYIPGVLQTQFPQGTLFRTEQILYDERKGRDVAGTVDLLGITPEGKWMIYDWKTKFLNTSVYSDIPYFSQQDYKIQLSQYKSMLRSYGVEEGDVIVAQAMPIVFTGRTDKSTGDVSLEGVSFPEVDIKNETNRFLLPVPIAEQSSGNLKIDEYVKALEQLHQILYKQKDLNKVLKAEQLNAISGAIRELQIKQEFGPLAEQGLIFIKGAERLLEDVNAQLKKDGEFINIDDKKRLEDYRAKIKNVVDNIHKYQSTYQLFIEIYGKEGLSEKDQLTLKMLETLALDSSVLASRMESEYKAFVAHYYTSKEGIDILKIEKPIRGVINRSLQSLSRMQNSALQYLRIVTSRANFDKQRDAITRQTEFQKILDAFKALGNAKGLSPREYFTMIAEKNSKGKPMNKLLKKIKTEFYTEFDKAIDPENPDIEWIKENIHLEKWTEAKEKDIEEFEKQVDDSIYVIGNKEEDDKEKERRKADYRAKFDMSKEKSLGWIRTDLKFYIKDEDKWKTDGYKAMSKDQAALDMYEFIITLNKEAKEIGYHDSTYGFSTRFLPWLRASTLDRIRTSGLSAIGDSIKSIYTLTPEEEISYARVDPNTGQLEKTIPAFFTKNFVEPTIEEDGSKTYDLSDVSTDIGETISMYIEAMYEYQSLSDIEGIIQSVRDVEAAKESYILDSKGRIVKEKGTNVVKVAKDNKDNVELYDSFVESILYKRQYSGDSNLSTGATKLIEKANQYFRLKVFGLNPFTPATTFIGGNLQGLINSRRLYKGRQFLKNELKIVGNLWKDKEGDVEKGLMDYFLPFTENRARLKAERMSLEKIQRFSFSDLVMSPIRKADIMIQMATSLSILENTVVIDGNLVNAREYILNSREYRDRYKDPAKLKELERGFEDRVQKLIAQKGVAKLASFKDGMLEIEGIDRNSETVNKLRLKILNEIRTITGNLSEENKIDADRNILLKSMMMFKRWIIPLATTRFGGLQKNIDTGTYEMGRARMLWNIMFNGDGGGIKGIPAGIKNLRDMLAGNVNGIKALQEYYERTAQTYKDNTGNELEMSPEEFYDMTRRAIMQQAKELGVLMTMLAGFMAIKGAGVPDDDESKNLYKVTVRMLDKLTDEISFYYNPLSLQQISTGSYLPSLGLLTDGIKFTNQLRKEGWGIITGNEELQESAHPIKALTSMIPVANQIFRTFIPLLNADMTKDLGISISTESRR